MRLVLQIEAEVHDTSPIVEAMDKRYGVVLTIPHGDGQEMTVEGALTGAKEPAGA